MLNKAKRNSIILEVVFLMFFLLGWGTFSFFVFAFYALGCADSGSCGIEAFILLAFISPVFLIARFIKILFDLKKEPVQNTSSSIWKIFSGGIYLTTMVIINAVLLVML
jgi:hypothetical protein